MVDPERRCDACTIFSFPQSQRQLQMVLPRLVRPTHALTVRRPNLCPVTSMILDVLPLAAGWNLGWEGQSNGALGFLSKLGAPVRQRGTYAFIWQPAHLTLFHCPNWPSERLDHRKVPNPIRSGPIAHLYMWRAALHVTACVTCHRSVTCHGALRLAARHWCTDERCTTCATLRKTGGGRPSQNISRLQAGRCEPYGEPCGAPVRQCATCTTPRKWVARLPPS
jgi:hypothetical protein